jgi:hypothetical protein
MLLNAGVGEPHRRAWRHATILGLSIRAYRHCHGLVRLGLKQVATSLSQAANPQNKGVITSALGVRVFPIGPALLEPMDQLDESATPELGKNEAQEAFRKQPQFEVGSRQPHGHRSSHLFLRLLLAWNVSYGRLYVSDCNK